MKKFTYCTGPGNDEMVAHLDLSRKEIPIHLKAQQRQNTNEIKNESKDKNI